MKHKLLTMLLAIVAAFCLCLGLAACGGNGPDTGGSQTGQGGNGPGDSSGGTEMENPGGGGTGGGTHAAEYFQVDETNHWKICTDCGEKFSEGKHNFNSDNTCETCGYSTIYSKGLQYSHNIITDTYTVSGIGTATDTELIIPAYYEGKAVASIRDDAFKNCWEVKLISVKIPDGVTSIGSSAFMGCTNLESVEIPNSVISIGQGAFQECTALASVKIPDGVTSIENGTFQECRNLTSIEIPNGVTSIGGGAFASCSKLRTIVIPDSVIAIGSNAFRATAYYNNDSNWDSNGMLYYGNFLIGASGTLSGAYTIKPNTKLIAGSVFSWCEQLTSIEIPDSVVTIGESAFYHCSELKSVTIGKGVTSIGMAAFHWCDKLQKVIISDLAAWCNIEFEYASNPLINHAHLYLGAEKVNELVIPDEVTEIKKDAFYNCDWLTSVTLHSGMTIREEAFQNCTGLTDIHFKGTVEEWQVLEEASDWNWNYNTGNYTVTCTNGTVKKNGPITYF